MQIIVIAMMVKHSFNIQWYYRVPMPAYSLPHAPGTLIRYEAFPSEYIPPRPVDIWLPPGYDPAADVRYPVLYMHDGQNLFRAEDSYAYIPWSVDQAVAHLMDAGTLPGVIVVGPWNVGHQRWSEYLPQKPAEQLGMRAFMHDFPDRLPAPAYSDHYLRFLVDELKPSVDANFRTLTDAQHTCVMGSSMGGLISLYALTEYPHIFGGAGCVSTHWVAGGNRMVDYFAKALPKAGTHRLYFDFGTETADAPYEPFQRRMDDHLQALGYQHDVDWVTYKFEGADHSEAAWRERVHLPLEFLFRGR